MRKKNKEYLRYLFYDMMHDVFKQTDASIVKRNIDLLASEMITDTVVKQNIYD